MYLTPHYIYFSCFSVQIVDSLELRTENTNRSSTLVIEEAKPQHTGRYTIVVKDRKSSAEHTITLSVIGESILKSQNQIK